MMMRRLRIARRVLWAVVLGGLAGLLFALLHGPLSPVGVVGAGLFMVGMVFVAPVNSLIRDLSGKTDRREHTVRLRRLGMLGWALSIPGGLVLPVGMIIHLPIEVARILLVAFLLGGVVLWMRNWLRMSGY